MTSMQKIVLVTGILIVMGTAPFQLMRAARVHQEVESTHQKWKSGERAKQRLLQQYSDATNKLAELHIAAANLQRQTADIYKLRGEVTRVRVALAETKEAEESVRIEDSALDDWISRIEALEGWLEKNPEQRVPEFKYLTVREWLNVARDTDVADADDMRLAAGRLRGRATGTFAGELARALDAYLTAHDDELPKNVGELHSHFDHPVEAAMLDRYTMLQSGRYNPEKPKAFVIAERAPVDNDRLRKMIRREDWSNEAWKSTNSVK